MSRLQIIQRFLRTRKKVEESPEEFFAQLEIIGREKQGIINITRESPAESEHKDSRLAEAH